MNTTKYKLLSPRGTALYLIEETGLTHQQIADFCDIHLLEVINLAFSENVNLNRINPVDTGETTSAYIQEAESNPDVALKPCISLAYEQYLKDTKKSIKNKKSKAHYALWLIINCPTRSDAEIQKFLNTTKSMVEKVRNKTYWNYKNLMATNPITDGICTEDDLYTFMHQEKKVTEVAIEEN